MQILIRSFCDLNCDCHCASILRGHYTRLQSKKKNNNCPKEQIWPNCPENSKARESKFLKKKKLFNSTTLPEILRCVSFRFLFNLITKILLAIIVKKTFPEISIV